MTATDELRRLLDERGVEWWYGFNEKSTVFDGAHDVRYEVDGILGLLFIRSALNVTPEQAITATLGRGTCHIVMTSPGWWECDECENSIDWDSCDPNDPPSCNFCPNCGREVVDE